MRPAQLTPENAGGHVGFRQVKGCFNEAGAINAGKPFGFRVGVRLNSRRFNEAGAINAGKHGGHGAVHQTVRRLQ